MIKDGEAGAFGAGLAALDAFLNLEVVEADADAKVEAGEEVPPGAASSVSDICLLFFFAMI